MGSGEVARRTPWQSVQRCAGDCGARVASPCGDDRRHRVAAVAGKLLLAAIHIGVSASSDTGSKFFTTSYRGIWVAPFTMSVCQWPMLTDVCDLNGCRCG